MADKDKKEITAKEDTGSAYRVLVRPHVSEKSFRGSQEGKYTFVVNKNANKIEIKKAIEKVYGVNVTRVNVINNDGKTLNFRGRAGKTSDWKKAVVTLKKGQIIGEAQA